MGDASRKSSVEIPIPPLERPAEPKSFWHFGTGQASVNGHDSVNLNWNPPLGPDGNLQPSTRMDGPWRGVETVGTTYGQQTIDISMQDTAQMPEQNAADLNEAIQQQLLLDLFWPGWPQFLPEPNIVNDL
jgi:hypothetical protein